MRIAVTLALLAFVGAGCKSKTKADLSTPETTLASFFKALNAGELPERIGTFVVSREEAEMWRMRCKTRGCKEGRFTVKKVIESGENGATFAVDYMVIGDGHLQVMKGTSSEIRFERQGASWGIVQFGRRLGAKAPEPAKANAADAADAAPPMPDADPSSDAATTP